MSERKIIDKAENKLVQLVSELLNTKNISSDNDFFDLGGRSVDAVILLNRLNDEFEIELPPELFEESTLRSMAEYIAEQLGQEQHADIESARKVSDKVEIDL